MGNEYIEARDTDILGAYSYKDRQAFLSPRNVEAVKIDRVIIKKPQILDDEDSYESLIKKVQDWATEKGFGDPRAQFMKIAEELGEASEAFNKERPEDLIDAIGDLQVTIVNFAMLVGVDYKGAFEEAWNTIKDRTGEMKNGVFVKSEDSKDED